jgi:YD repeat-containing protein
MIYKVFLSFLLVLFLFSSEIELRGQTPPFSAIVAKASQNKTSPSAEMLVKLNEVGVDLFTGAPSMNIPLYNLVGDNLKYDIGISYHTSGIKVNEKPTWVGLGWSLEGEAQIVRKVNQLPDETHAVIERHNGVALTQGYYYLGSQLNTPDWLSETFLSQAINTMLSPTSATVAQRVLDGEPDEFVFNFSGYSGSFYRTEKGTWAVKSKQNLSFKIEEEVHTWLKNGVNSPYYFHPFGSSNTSVLPGVASLFTKFIITTPNGYQYTFGGTETAIEISRGILPNGDFDGKKINEYYSANSWKLTKIKDPLGEEINFTYDRGEIIYERNRSYIQGVKYQGGVNTTLDPVYMAGSSNAKLNYDLTVIYPVYLSSIETKKNIVSFCRSKSKELNYNRLPSLLETETYYMGWSDNNGLGNPYSEKLLAFYAMQSDYGSDYMLPLNSSFGTTQNAFQWYGQQLDTIKLFDKLSQKFVDGIKFNHSADSTSRRTLNSIFRFNFYDNNTSDLYSFEYDDVVNMKKYESMAKDPWGFQSVENNEFKINGLDALSLNYGQSNFPNMKSAYSTKGTLKKIINPLGGSIELIYEPNKYSARLKGNHNTNTIDLVPTNGDITGAGVRVAKVIRKDYFGAPPQIVRYEYLTDPFSNNSLSSGILNFDDSLAPVAAYHCPDSNYNYKVTFFEFGTDMYNNRIRQYRGGIVTYSMVKEIKPDGSFIIYKFSNSDDLQYRDEFHLASVSLNIISSYEYRQSSMDLERGNQLQARMYTKNGTLIKETNFTYLTAINRKNEYIKAISHQTINQKGGYNAYTCPSPTGDPNNVFPPSLKKMMWAYKIYTYKNPLTKTVEKSYNEDGTVVYMLEKNFVYDSYGNLVLESESTSDNKILTAETKFNSHPDYDNTTVSGTHALGLKNLNTLGIKNYPVEKIHYSTQHSVPPNTQDVRRILAANVYTYKSNKPVIEEEYSLELSNPINGMFQASLFPYGFKSSKISPSGIFEMDNRLISQKKYLNYTVQPFGNKPKTVLTKESSEAILWDYNGLFPVASFGNSISDEVAYTGFEGNYDGANGEFKNGWTFNGNNFQTNLAKIGKGALFTEPVSTKHFSNSCLYSNISLANGKVFKLCFWASSNSGLEYYYSYGTNLVQLHPKKVGWDNMAYYEVSFTGLGPSAGNLGLICYKAPSGSGPAVFSIIDEVTLMPVNCAVKTVSYNGATGQILSVNDGNGNLELYEYDNFGRLLKVRDERGHLLVEHEYKIQVQN